jgi:cyclic beta-1,2-glucan synthetase
MYRVAVESVLGLTVEEGASLQLRPCIPASWPGYSLRYRVPGHETQYAITVTQARPRPAQTVASLDGRPLDLRSRHDTPLTDGVDHHASTPGKDVGSPRCPGGG